MDNLNISATTQTPAIYFDEENQTLNMIGECYPENITKFSLPLFAWLNNYLMVLETQLFTVNIELIYFNSSSSKMLLDLFDCLQSAVVENQKNIVVNWIYDVENESALEYGEEFKEDLNNLNFNLIEKN
ncbi:MAG: hypothetical protein RIT27_1983 [Pseudomonadota bacterium]|jgi:hypothetical protein